ncbi:MAG: hypothetical protein JWO06_2776 [Bacteroidota bacterium]|nr:hypothetical protein [Bacteroidota bacterium]
MKSLIHRWCLVFMVICFLSNAKAQSEYFVNINPALGTFSDIRSIPGVTLIIIGPSGTALDKTGNRFFFYGNNPQSQWCIYTLDMPTGNVLNQALLTAQNASTLDWMGQLAFDDSSKVLYGLNWSSTNQTMSFSSISEVTGTVTLISSVPGLNGLMDNDFTYDQNHHIYMFVGSDANGSDYLYSFRSTDGVMVSKVAITSNDINQIRYDNSTNTLYCENNNGILSVNTSTLATTPVVNFPQPLGLAQVPNYTTFDEIHHRYITGCSDNNGLRLYSVDVAAHTIVTNPLFPVGLNTGENVIELNYNNSNGVLYALHWGTEPLMSINAQGSTATCNGTCTGTASVSPANGIPPYTYHWLPVDSNTASISNLCAGTYYVTVTDSAGTVLTDSVKLPGAANITVTATAYQSPFCQGDSAELCALPTGFAAYAWNNYGVDECIFTYSAGNYVVTVTDQNGCTAVSNTVSVSSYPSTSVSFSQNGDTLTCYNANCQWYFNTQLLTDDTAHTLIADQSGIYTVQTTDSNGCHYSSTDILINTGISDLPARININIYPNPLSSGAWNIDIGEDLLNSSFKIFDATARVVYKGKFESLHSHISPDLAAGNYILQIQTQATSYNIKLVKIK